MNHIRPLNSSLLLLALCGLLIVAGCPQRGQQEDGATQQDSTETSDQQETEALPTLEETSWLVHRVNRRESLSPVAVTDEGRALALTGQQEATETTPHLITYKPGGEAELTVVPEGVASNTVSYSHATGELVMLYNSALAEASQAGEQYRIPEGQPMADWELAAAEPEGLGENEPETLAAFEGSRYNDLLPFTSRVFTGRWDESAAVVLYNPGDREESGDEEFYLFASWREGGERNSALIPFPGELHPLLPLRVALADGRAYVLSRDSDQPTLPAQTDSGEDTGQEDDSVPPQVEELREQGVEVTEKEDSQQEEDSEPQTVPRSVVLKFDLGARETTEVWSGRHLVMDLAVGADGERVLWGTVNREASRPGERFNYFRYSGSSGETESVTGARGLWGSPAASSKLTGQYYTDRELSRVVFHDEFGSLVNWQPGENSTGEELGIYLEPGESVLSRNLNYRLGVHGNALILSDVTKLDGLQERYAEQRSTAVNKAKEVMQGLGVDQSTLSNRYQLSGVYQPFSQPEPEVTVRVQKRPESENESGPFEFLRESPTWFRYRPESEFFSELYAGSGTPNFFEHQQGNPEDSLKLESRRQFRNPDQAESKVTERAIEIAELMGISDTSHWSSPRMNMIDPSEMGVARAVSAMFPLVYETKAGESTVPVHRGSTAVTLARQDLRLRGFFYDPRPVIEDQPIELTREEAWQTARDFLADFQSRQLELAKQQGREAQGKEIPEEMPRINHLRVHYPRMDGESLEVFAPRLNEPRIAWAFTAQNFGTVYVDAKTGEIL